MPRRAAALLAAVALLLAACGDDDGGGAEATTTAPASGTAPAQTTTTEAPGEETGAGRSDWPDQPQVDTITTGLEVPWDIAFLPDGRALVTERPGRIRLVGRDGALRDEPVATPETQAEGEGGLMGIDLDPEFDEHPFAYVYVTRAGGVEVERMRWDGERLRSDGIVLDGIQAGPIHDSGRLRFGPDDHLYVATGDAGDGSLAQQRDSLNGKFLRLTLEQARSSADDPEIVSLGHRNPQGLDWHPGTGRLIATEHGPSGIDAPAGFDEINVIREGRDYGWPEVYGADHGDFTGPALLWEPPLAPSGAAFATAPGSAWEGDFLVAMLRGEQLRRVRFDGDGQVTGDQALLEGEHGRLRAVVEAPDGSLWVTTSNRDGRGQPRDGDDRILRVVPPAG